MYVKLEHLDGACAGQIRIVQKDFVTIGRHASAEIRFDAERDVDVSGRHAALFRSGDGWMLRDLGSTNGTFVNGERLRGDRLLVPHDVIGFGPPPRGPRVRFEVEPGTAPEPPTTRVDAEAPTRPMARGPVLALPYRGGTTERVRVRVERATASWRRAAALVIVAALLLVAMMAWQVRSRTRALERHRLELLARVDSLLGELSATESGVAALTAALDDARREASRLRGSLVGRPGADDLDSLSRAVSAGVGRHQGALRAARLDVGAIARRRADAVALVVSELAGGRRVSGTGFTLLSRADTAWVVTNRHLVQDSAGQRPRRLGAIFHRSAQNFRAHVVAMSNSADLALLAVPVRGGAPAGGELATGAAPGDAVAVLGYPFGLEFPMGGDWRKVGVSATTFSGTVTRVAADTLQIDGYGARGSSGSPVFDATGSIVGVVYGGAQGSHGRLLYAVPVAVVEAWLRELGFK
ncbi:MAG: trypsin-like peptidase domain-containing protein [Gemmatimonadales bacterium]